MSLTFRAVFAFLMLAGSWPSASSANEPFAHHDIIVKFDPRTRQIDVTDVITFGLRNEISFRLANWVRVVHAKAGTEKVFPRRDQGAWRISVSDRSFEKLTLTLTGKVPPLPTSSESIERRGAVAGLEGSYLPGFVAWLADTGDEWVKFRLRVEVPMSQRAIATGRLTDEAHDGSSYRATFVADHRSELPSLFVGPYTVKESRVGKVRLRTYFHEEVASFDDHYLVTANQYIEEFSTQIGEYPFDGFYIISSPLPVGLGFPYLTYVGRVIVPLSFMRGRSLAHEVLHNWWGNGVAIDYARGNWAEGLTTYMADYSLAAADGQRAAREMRLGWLRDYAALPMSRDLPLIDFTSKKHESSQVIGYNKAAFIFHMLRKELDDALFADGLRLFWNRHKFKLAGWPEIQDAFEGVSGRNLDWFFKQWLHRTGAPKIELVKATIKNSGTVLVTLRQSKPSYRVTVPVDLNTTAGHFQHLVRLDVLEDTFELSGTVKPLGVSVDPAFDVFRRLLLGENPTILRDVTLAKKVTSMVLSVDNGFQEAAKRLTHRILNESKIMPGVLEQAPTDGPVLVIGKAEAISSFMHQIGSLRIPEQVKLGTAAAWVTRSAGGHPILFIRAADVEALEGLIRPLPHYGRQSYVVFDGRQAIRKGIWPTESNPLRIRFSD